MSFRSVCSRIAPVPALAFALALAWALPPAPAAHALEPVLAEGGTRVYAVEDSYDFIRESLQMAITDQGLLVSTVMHIDTMLERTGPDLGMPADPYTQSESLEFCSAYISHLMSQAHPANSAACPFAINVYTTHADPGTVFVAFRTGTLLGSGEAKARAEAAIDDMMTGIVEAALSF